MDCLFCNIVSGITSCHKIWEDELHLAFLTIFPNTQGASVVIPKKHYESYVFNLEADVLSQLILASKKVAKLLDATFEDVARTGLVFEGFGINHVHAKLFPLHGTNFPEWKPIKSHINSYFEKYPGYISSHDADRADDNELKQIAEEIFQFSLVNSS